MHKLSICDDGNDDGNDDDVYILIIMVLINAGPFPGVNGLFYL
jgi:hypothetical protein